MADRIRYCIYVTNSRPDKAKPPSGSVRRACLMALRLSGLQAFKSQTQKSPSVRMGFFTN
ncbi:Uncharacterised protein [Kluyvera ascorbata]|nr:hypothetical protein KATP_42630 [Kluyvera ascorbata]STX00802.1 Uncharacterised protein [Kluyvera ascorbata]